MIKLYYKDAYIHSFEANVLSVTDEGIVLDRTAFFPEGGGQSSDIGFINNAKIYDVCEVDGIIYHKAENSSDISEGDIVLCHIDFHKRFSDMQNHSGEHIVSGIVHNKFGYDNVGFHLNDKEIALDFNGVLTDEDISFVESEANRAVWNNIEIKAFFPTEKEASSLNYRSKKDITSDLRLVDIEGIDICACCAPHVRRTGEIGLIKVVGHEKHRGGTRVYILCGERALKDYEMKQHENKKIGNMLKVKENETSQAVEALLKKKSDVEYLLQKAEISSAEQSADRYEESDVIVAVDCYKGHALTHFANRLSEKSRKLTAAFGNTGENSFQYMIISKDIDIKKLVKEMNAALNGRGGGKANTAQGSVNCSEEEIYHFFKNTAI